jgi:hypothetical protein
MSFSRILYLIQFQPATFSLIVLQWFMSSRLLRVPPFFFAAAMFHEFQAAQFSSLLFKFCNVFLNSAACSICLLASQMLTCFMSSSRLLISLTVVLACYVFLVVLQCFMSSRLRYFPHCFLDATIAFYEFQDGPFSLLFRKNVVLWVPAPTSP